MRSFIPAYQMVAPQTLDEVLGMLNAEPGKWRPFAGGTDLMVLLEAGKLDHKAFINIWHLEELRGITSTDEYVDIGALATYTDLQQHPVICGEFPLLTAAARETGGLAIQNRGTLGGNIANASPAADSPPALLVYDAELELVSAQGTRRTSYHDFHTGYKLMRMRPEELIRSIRLPRDKRDWVQTYRKVGTRKAQAISKICFAAAAKLSDGVVEDIRIALGSVAPIVVRCVNTETAIRKNRISQQTVDTAAAALGNDILPIDDIRSTKHYRGQVALNLLTHFLISLKSATLDRH
jgi:CO/xanthine dehydrogenase FAD-binding subunit